MLDLKSHSLTRYATESIPQLEIFVGGAERPVGLRIEISEDHGRSCFGLPNGKCREQAARGHIRETSPITSKSGLYFITAAA